MVAVTSPRPSLNSSPHAVAPATHHVSLFDHLPQPWPPAVALLLPLLLGLVVTPWAIGFLARHGMGQRIREEGPQSHAVKGGTPTSAGLIVFALVRGTLLAFDPSSPPPPVLAALAFASSLRSSH